MIDARELRIGNWVERNDNWSYRSDEPNKRFQWNESDWYALGECTLFLEDISPIPLTTEILKKCIGVNSGEGKYWFNLEHDVYFAWNEERKCVFLYESSGDGSWYGVPIKFVHQFQNTHFALTQKELEIKL